MFGNQGASVRLECEVPNSVTDVYWYYDLSILMLVHFIGSDPVYKEGDGFLPSKYVYSTHDHSLTVTSLSFQDQVCYRCTTIPSVEDHTWLISVLSECVFI